SLKISIMGTHLRFLRWVPYQGFGPLLSWRHYHRPRSKGRGPASLLSSYGAVDRSINSGVSFGKGGWGYLSHRFSVRAGIPESPDQRRCRDLDITFTLQDEGSRPVARLRR